MGYCGTFDRGETFETESKSDKISNHIMNSIKSFFDQSRVSGLKQIMYLNNG